MKSIIGIIIIVIGIALGLYLGGYLMLYGGIMDVVNNLDPLQIKYVVLGAFKIIFCSVGFTPCWFGPVIGLAMIGSDN